MPFEVQGLWYSGKTNVLTYAVEELLGTKFRALYQRKKGRDLFDMSSALQQFPALDPEKIIQSFQRYLAHQKVTISRAQFEANLAEKMRDKTFLADMTPLLRPDSPAFDWVAAEKVVKTILVERLPGAPWKGDGKSKATKLPPKSKK
jgi:predicted nucleotidyltransferase component of viral defense system